MRTSLIHIDMDTNKEQTEVQGSLDVFKRELPEEDMIEKAVKAFAEACEMYAGNERCLECVKCRDCARVKQFRQRLEKR